MLHALLLCLSLVHADAPKSLLIQDFFKTVKLNEVVEFHPIANHHFNMKAPQLCEGHPALAVRATAVQCQFTRPGRAQVSLKICDDKETFCRDERFQLKVKGVASRAKTEAHLIDTPKAEVPPPPGFLQNEPDKALRTARKEKKLMLIDFYGIWCPPCNRMDEIVFSSGTFQNAAKDFVKIKMDSDSDVSWKWKNQFHVTYLPTLIVTDSHLHEIGRVVGSRPLGVFTQWLADQVKLQHEPVEKAAKIAGKNMKSTDPVMLARRARVGDWYFNQNNFKMALHYLTDLKDRTAQAEALQSKISLAKDRGAKKAELVALYRDLLDQFNDQPEYLDWLSDLVDLDKHASKYYVSHLKKTIQQWTPGVLAAHGYRAADVTASAADIWDSFGDKDQAHDAYLQAAAEYAELAQQSHLKIARGPNLERAYCLYKAQQYPEAEHLYQSLITTYPKEFTFHFDYASTLFRMKKYDQAMSQVVQAQDYAYGDNWIRTAILKVKIEMAQKQPARAKATAQMALERIVLPKSSQIRTHRYYQDLRALLLQLDQKAKL